MQAWERWGLGGRGCLEWALLWAMCGGVDPEYMAVRVWSWWWFVVGESPGEYLQLYLQRTPADLMVSPRST